MYFTSSFSLLLNPYVRASGGIVLHFFLSLALTNTSSRSLEATPMCIQTCLCLQVVGTLDVHKKMVVDV